MRALLDRSPLSLRAVAALALVLAVMAGGYFGLLAPKLRETQSLRSQLATMRRSPPAPAPAEAPITPAERELWKELEERLRGRYPREADLPRVTAMVASLARSAGVELLTLEIDTSAGQPTVGLAAAAAATPPPFRPPPELAVNPSTVKVVMKHRYRDLVEFVDRLPEAPVYVAVKSLEIKRIDNHLMTEAVFASLRWAK